MYREWHTLIIYDELGNNDTSGTTIIPSWTAIVRASPLP
jgi:hypothetical protein